LIQPLLVPHPTSATGCNEGGILVACSHIEGLGVEAVHSLDKADTTGVVLDGHEQAHHLVHDDDGMPIGGEQDQVLSVDMLDPLPALHIYGLVVAWIGAAGS